MVKRKQHVMEGWSANENKLWKCNDLNNEMKIHIPLHLDKIAGSSWSSQSLYEEKTSCISPVC